MSQLQKLYTHQLLIIIILFIGTACDNDDGSDTLLTQPDRTEFVFQIVDENGNDFIHSYPNYSVSKITFTALDHTGTEQFEWARSWTTDDTLIFFGTRGYQTFEHLRTINYGNGDLDTLYLETIDDNNGRIQLFNYCFNGESCVEIDLEVEEDLKNRMAYSWKLLESREVSVNDIAYFKLVKK